MANLFTDTDGLHPGPDLQAAAEQPPHRPSRCERTEGRQLNPERVPFPPISCPVLACSKESAGSARVRRGRLSNLFFKRFSMAPSNGVAPHSRRGDGAEPTPGSVEEPEVIGVRIALVHSQCQLRRNGKFLGFS